MDIKTSYDRRAKAVYFKGGCEQLLRDMPDKSVDLIFTSPPYCMGKDYESSSSVQDFKVSHTLLLPEIYRVLKPGGSICWQVGYHVSNGVVTPLDYLVYEAFSRLPDVVLRNRIIWSFGHGLHCTNRFSGRHETILWFTKGKDFSFDVDPVRVKQKYPGKTHYKGEKKGEPSGNPLGKNPGDVWEIPNVKANHLEKTIHPCQFPIGLVDRFVLALTKKGQVVFDPFAGVASAGCAALLQGRRFIGAEPNGEYHAVGMKRLKQALDGTLKYRDPTQPVHVPNPNSKVATDPFKE